MHEEGVKTWSLTDHDTTSGWNEAAQVAASLGMHFLPGVEITCEPALEPDHNHLAAIGRERASASWHLLAYFPEHQPGVNDETVAGFKAWLEPHQDGRLPRMKAMCQRLTELGMPVDVEDVCRRASGSVGRPHLAQAMVELGYVSSKVEAFETWIGDDDNSSLHSEIKTALKTFTTNGPETFFIHGNRDFLVGQSFAEQTGITILPDPYTLEINGQKVILSHGDFLCIDDKDYIGFRNQVNIDV